MRATTGSRIGRSVVKACLSTDVRKPIQVAMRAALRQATRRSLVAHRRLPIQTRPAVEGQQVKQLSYAPGEKGTLELGSWIVLGTMGLGLEFGRWPAWSVLVVAGGYLVWVMAYSEATVQVRRRWPESRRLRVSPAASEQPALAPPKEQRTS